MQRYLVGIAKEIAYISARIIFTAIIVYLFFSFNTLYAIGFIQDISIVFLVLFALYQVLVLLMAFCFFRLSISKNCTTLELFPGVREQEEESSESLNLNPFEKGSIETEQGEMDICDICRTSRPSRSFHCFTCDRCFLLMYKHSYWLDICIGFTNYKFYTLFLFYALLVCMLSIGCFIHGTVLHKIDEIGSILVPMIIALTLQVFVFLFVLFELCTAIYSILINQTIEERKYLPSSSKISYNLGYKNNWKMIMGHRWYMWFLPMWSTEGNGLTFPYVRKEDPRTASSHDTSFNPLEELKEERVSSF